MLKHCCVFFDVYLNKINEARRHIDIKYDVDISVALPNRYTNMWEVELERQNDYYGQSSKSGLWSRFGYRFYSSGCHFRRFSHVQNTT